MGGAIEQTKQTFKPMTDRTTKPLLDNIINPFADIATFGQYSNITGEGETSIGNQLEQGLFDVATLGQAYSARKAKEMQERALNEARDNQARELARLEALGPAPTIVNLSASELERSRRNRLKTLRQGIASTLNTSLNQNLSNNQTNKPKAKRTLGA